MKKEYLNTKGRIFDIQKFSVHDGPGIRTIVFFKGCIFRCKWCCNPESQEFDVENMLVNGKNRTIGQDIAVKEIMEIIEKDRPFYRRSKGGVTLSGGECLCQIEFAKALLHACKESGINTAIETTGGVSFELIESILPEIDTILMDIKHMDPEKHEKFTGRGNKLILENARKIAVAGAGLIIRIPVIPSFNDQKYEITAIAEFAKSLRGVTKLHLLAYHRLGQDKYDALGRNYSLKNLELPTNEYMEQLLEVVKATGLEGQIGG
ncbi:MAG: glycyl-radical enzyme activating protein [Proteocatella sp.]